MLLCAAGVSAQPNLMGSGVSPLSMTDDSMGRYASMDRFTDSMDSSTPSIKMHHASVNMTMNHHNHGMMGDGYQQSGADGLYIHGADGSYTHGADGSHESAQGNQCCGEKSKSTNVAFASLVPVGALFVIFWLIGLLVRRQSPARWWKSPTVGYHYPRHHLVNCTFLN
ncbi:hypothetical protein BTA51_29550 [Hahella sp. CCB-MM4]|nr:hypothetical protein BTA51_29550 [Hahella sp. CCB-MM4]